MEIVENTVDQCVENLKSFYGERGTLHISEDEKSYALVLEEQPELIEFETLKKFLPVGNYDALCKMDPSCTTQGDFSVEEKLLRDSFHNGGEIPNECKSKIFILQNHSTVKKVEEDEGDRKTKKRTTRSNSRLNQNE
jgi:hypothetical protein